MKFGYFVSGSGMDRSKSFKQAYEDSVEQYVYLDEAGFDNIWFPEHHFVTTLVNPGPLYSVVDAAHRTKNARLGAAVILSPYYHPLILAEQIAQVDHMTEGRLEVAFGRGSYLYEYERLAMTVEESSERQLELLEILMGVWSKDEVFSYNGKYYSFPDTYPFPRPLQQPHPPIGVGTRSPDTIKFVVENNLDLHTNPLRQPIENSYAMLRLLDSVIEDIGAAQRPRVLVQREIAISPDRAKVEAAMNALRERHYAAFHLHQNTARVSKAYAEPDPLPAGLEISTEELIRRSLAGDVETCIERLREYEEMGFDQLIVSADFGQPQSDIMESLKLFAEKVMPHFKDDSAKERQERSRATRAAAVAAGERAPMSVEDQHAIYEHELGPDWRDWGPQEWLDYFDSNQASNGDRRCYVFDYSLAPRVKADGAGFIVEGKLMMLRNEGCPVCSRPVIAIYRRHGDEDLADMQRHVHEALESSDWHLTHP